MQDSAENGLSRRKNPGPGPRQTTCLGSISDPEAEDAIANKTTISSSSTSHSQFLTPAADCGWNHISSVRYPKSHLIFRNSSAEDLPAGNEPGRLTQVESV